MYVLEGLAICPSWLVTQLQKRLKGHCMCRNKEHQNFRRRQSSHRNFDWCPPLNKNVVRVQILCVMFFYFQMLPMYYLPTHDDDGFIFLFFRQSRSFVMLERNFFLLVQKADKEYFAIFYYNTKYSMLHINKSKEKCSKRNSHALLRAGYH